MDIAALTPEVLDSLRASMTPKLTKYIPVKTTPKQTAAVLMNNVYEMLFGGAAGGGKSVFILAAALQYMDVPEYSAILFRKTFADLMLPGALIPLSQQWLAPYLDDGTVRWYEKDKKYVFREYGSTLNFGYLDAKDDHLRYQGAAFQFVGFDEVTHINPEHFRYLHSRVRKPKSMKVPLRIRATANPGGTYGEYYYSRYFLDIAEANAGLEYPKRVFLPSSLRDNPHLDEEEYRKSLAELDPITRKQLEEGDWEIREHGDVIDTQWFLMIDHELIPSNARKVRYWDLAAIDPRLAQRKGRSKNDPDYTTGLKMSYDGSNYYIEDIVHVRLGPGDTQELVLQTAIADSSSTRVRMEQEGGSSGIITTDLYRRLLRGFDFSGIASTQSKVERAKPFAAAAQRGSIFISKRCRYLTELFAEAEAFPYGAHDDMIDACSGAFNAFIASQPISAPEAHRLQVARQSRLVQYQDNDDAYTYNVPLIGSYWGGTGGRSMSNRRR